MLSGNEIELLYSFYDWLGLPCEVIVMLLSYAAKQGKVGKRYLETVAIDWADKGIDTFDKAEEYITQLEEIGSNEHKIRTILGIYDRALTQTEKKYISAWTEELNISPELVSLAYDKTVENTGKLRTICEFTFCRSLWKFLDMFWLLYEEKLHCPSLRRICNFFCRQVIS